MLCVAVYTGWCDEKTRTNLRRPVDQKPPPQVPYARYYDGGSAPLLTPILARAGTYT